MGATVRMRRCRPRPSRALPSLSLIHIFCEQITAQGGLPQCVIQCGGRARFFGDLDEGIDSFEAPEIGYDVDRSYDNLYTGNRVKLGDMAKEYTEADVHHLPDVGNGPHFAYILRDRDWKGGE